MVEQSREKMLQKLQSVLGTVVVTPSPLRCEGSYAHPDCKLPLTLSMQQEALRQGILRSFLNGGYCPNHCKITDSDVKSIEVLESCPHCGSKIVPDEEERRIGADLLTQCLLCMVEHSEVKPYYLKGHFHSMRILSMVRQAAESIPW